MAQEATVARYHPPRAADISVVVCTRSHGRWPHTQKTLLSLQHQLVPVGQVVLVIDGNDPLLATAQETYPDLTVLANPFRRGLPGARDAGAALCTGGITAFVDDDATLAPDWSWRMAAGYDGPDVVGVGGRIEPDWPRGRRPGWWPPEFDWVVGCSYRGLPRGRYSIDGTTGTGLSLRTTVLVAVGGFDFGPRGVHSTPTGCDELDICQRARRCRSSDTILYEPAAVSRKAVASDRTTWRYFLRRCYAEGAARALVPRPSGDGSPWPGRGVADRVLPMGAVGGLLHRDPRRCGATLLGMLAAWLGYAASGRR